MILAIAERVHNPELSDERVASWSYHWHEQRLRCILATPAMTRGGILTRLHNLIGCRPERVVNLLWPDNQIGTWDAAEGRRSASDLREWLSHDPSLHTKEARLPVKGVVLLGKRVVEAFGLRHEGWGAMMDGGDMPPILLLPHPSGRNRLLNDESFRSRLRRSASKFATLAKV